VIKPPNQVGNAENYLARKMHRPGANIA